MSCAVRNVTRLLTRSCYAAIKQRTSWDQLLFVSPEIHNNFPFAKATLTPLMAVALAYGGPDFAPLTFLILFIQIKPDFQSWSSTHSPNG